ncbi:MAG TPA: hypothetical protein VHQ93_05105 [Chitinophagaceae bacterium]|jgi:hypothetical protein|nr:hypothetical protein [Chitinophagaceae bacterium]
MKKLFIISLFFFHQSMAQVGFGDMVTPPRVVFGIQKIRDTEKRLGLNRKNHPVYFDYAAGKKEGYSIKTEKNITRIKGSDASGLMYGCLEFASQLDKLKAYPKKLDISDAPEMVLRGQCIGLQKSTYLPGRNVYEYPYTPETFPWFYDKKLWIQVLDSMLENRMNSLYLWNGHPFASLVKLKDYPYAVEVDDATFKKNEEIYRFITSEADKRGIWVIQMFYNIIVSKPFAEHYQIKTQERERHIIPLIADYTRKSIAAFVEKYPNVGLMVCLGEAMEGVGNDDIEWFTKTIIPGVQDGLKALGKTEEPPIVLRAHDTDAPSVMKAALPLYKNLYTEAKFNGEALTYPRPRGSWAELHQTLSKLGSVQIENVHILANLEPFRYGSPDFIQQCVIGMHEVMGGNGLHLYPQASYWDWPYSADKVQGKRLLQIERDWIWYKAWARYAWKAKRNRDDEIKYWSNLLANKFGCSEADGRRILATYELTGEIAPKLLRRFGITDGNRQTLTLGMLMTQLINPYRYGLFTLLYDSEAPEGEMLVDWVDKDVKGEPHIGETPKQVRSEVMYNAGRAIFVIDRVGKINKDLDEYLRWRMDVYLYYVLVHFYDAKIEAANYVLRYKYNQNIEFLEQAYRYLNFSVQSYREFALMTAKSYLYANSMQTQQRKIPMRGVDGTYKHWKEMLPVFEAELNTFKHKLDSLKRNTGVTGKQIILLRPAEVISNEKYFVIDANASVFTDTGMVIKSFAPELKGLKGLHQSFKQQQGSGTTINFTCDKPVKVLVGFFKTQRAAFTTDTIFLKEPELETNASADDYGQAEIKITNAVAIDGMPPVNIHAYNFKAGAHQLKLGKGVCLVLGFVDGQQVIPIYDAMLMSDAKNKNIDWLFE